MNMPWRSALPPRAAGQDAPAVPLTTLLQGRYSFDSETCADVVWCLEVAVLLDEQLWLVDPDGGDNTAAWVYRSRGGRN